MRTELSKEQHIAESQRRAIEILESGDPLAAIHSLLGDLGRQENTEELQAPANAMIAKGAAESPQFVATVRHWIRSIR